MEIIAQIKELPAIEQVKVAKFMAESGGSPPCSPYSIGTESDGLPVIHGQGGTFTSQLVQAIESRTP